MTKSKSLLGKIVVGVLTLSAIVSCSLPLLDRPDDAFAPNHTAATAADISAMRGKWVSGVARTEDWFLFTVPGGETRITLKLEFDYATTDLDLGLYDTAGALLWLSATTDSNEHIDHMVPTGGDYLARVYDSSAVYRAATYTLQWDCGPP